MRSERKLGQRRMWTPFLFLKASFYISPPTMLDFVGENLTLSG